MLVLYYMPWCKKAEKLLPILEKLSAYFMTARLRVAKYDTTANENAGVPINNLTLKLFTRKGVKSGIVVKYHPDEAKTLESLKNFLRKHSPEYRLAFPTEEITAEKIPEEIEIVDNPTLE